jgi:hypothetical protein
MQEEFKSNTRVAKEQCKKNWLTMWKVTQKLKITNYQCEKQVTTQQEPLWTY